MLTATTNNVLFPVRADRDTDWAVNFLVDLYRREQVRIHLLSVRMPYDGAVRMFFDDADLRRVYREDGEAELKSVCDVLDRARVPYVKHVAVGRSADTIAEYAKEYRCRQIVIGPQRSSGTLSQLLLGSLTRQVQHLMHAAGQPCEVL
jgi:nucleotide-binding universal stress UspA family protein